jgi:NADH-quinone oxidoreductase subunit A
LFDIEAIFIYPWAATLRLIRELNYWVIIDFLLELIAGYIYGWRVGAFDF